MRGVFATAAVTSFLIVSLAGGCGRAGAPSAPSSAGSTPAVVRTLVEVTADLVDVTKGYTGTDNWVGQSVTIPGTGSYNNVRFSWYHYNPAGVPTAFGTLYLLKQEYLGVPGGLSDSTPGFVARSERVSEGQYVFPPGITLVGGTRYWFYGDTRGRLTTGFNTDTYSGGDLYVTGMPELAFRMAQASWLLLPSGEYLKPPPGTCVDANFKLQGAPTSPTLR